MIQNSKRTCNIDICLLLAVFDLVAFAVDRVVSRTVIRLFIRGLAAWVFEWV